MPRHERQAALSPPGRVGTPSGRHLGYMPALDGVRACAVLAVMAFHGGISFMPGGFFGVDAFFVLSGFLITSLLVTERLETGGIALRSFWARRARRLLPALLVVIVAVVLYARFIATPGSYPDLRADAFSAMFYVANWHFILSGQNYFIAAGPTSPLIHTWSLAIEEQFYIVWPLIVVLVLRTSGSGDTPRSTGRSLRILLAVCLAGAAASAIEMAVMFHPGEDTTRVYFGSDTHAQCLLVGAALATGVTLWRRRGSEHVTSAAARRVLDAVAIAGIAVCAWCWSHLDYGQNLVFKGGFAIVSVAVAAVLVSVVMSPGGIVSLILSFRPLRYLGRISYGMYLWHFPLDIALTASRVGVGGYWLFVVRTGTTIAVATVSYYALERPIRSGSFLTKTRAMVATPVALVATAVVLVLATGAPALAAAANAPKLKPAPAAGVHKDPTRALSTYSKDPVRVLVVGDSVALTLAAGLAHAESPYRLQIYNEGIIGCGVAVGEYYEQEGVVTQSGAPCSPDPEGRQCYLFRRAASEPCQSWESAWKEWLTQLHPNVVVLLAGRWEVVDRTNAAGQWTNILAPSFAEYIRQQLEMAVTIGTSTGAKMVLETAPCFDSGEQPNGDPWPEDSPARLAVYNDLVRQVAAQFPKSVSVQDLYSVVCPDDQYTTDLNGVPVRSADGVHFLQPTSTAGDGDFGGEYLAPALLPLWESLGHEQEAQTRGASIVKGPALSPFYLAAQ